MLYEISNIIIFIDYPWFINLYYNICNINNCDITILLYSTIIIILSINCQFDNLTINCQTK